MKGYLSLCQHSMFNRSLLVLTDMLNSRICRARLHVSINTCQSTNLFPTTSQNCQKSDFTYYRHTINGTGICSSSRYNIVHQPVRLFSEFEKDDRKKPVTFSTPKDRIQGGRYSTENILMPETFPTHVFPNFTSLLQNLFSQLNVRQLDKELTVPDFLSAAKKAVIVVANLLSSGNVDEIESLTTAKAFKQIRENYSKIPATYLEQLSLEEELVFTPVRHIHRVKITPPARSDPSAGKIKKLDIVVLFEGYQGETADEKVSIFTKMANKKRFVCTARFERDYFKAEEGWESSEAWKISGICFVIQNTVDDERQNFII